VAVDGKTVRGSARLGLPAVHVVRAFVVTNHLVLGQLATEEKSNEITAIPALLKTLALEGALVTIDAMGAQHTIVDTIVDQKADYLVTIKDNQPTLHAELQSEMGWKPAETRTTNSFFQSENKGHGRKERRRVWTETTLAHLPACQTWTKATTLVRVESERVTKQGTSVEDRYYLSSRKLTAKQASEAIRGHWAIENECHWSLDVVLGEDACRIADGNAAENLSLVRSMVLAALKRSQGKLSKFGTRRLSMRQTQKVCGWDQETLLEVAGGLFSDS
jgi:predicted transposase YbfD/YdcC